MIDAQSSMPIMLGTRKSEHPRPRTTRDVSRAPLSTGKTHLPARPEAKLLKQLQDENGKLKKLLADAMLDNAPLKDPLSKNGDARCEARGSCLSEDRLWRLRRCPTIAGRSLSSPINWPAADAFVSWRSSTPSLGSACYGR
jgi:hypothetical protein